MCNASDPGLDVTTVSARTRYDTEHDESKFRKVQRQVVKLICRLNFENALFVQ